MGWLSWTEEQTLGTTIPSILLAYEGRQDMLKAIFGSSEEAQKPVKKAARSMSPQLFDAMFGTVH